VGPLTQIVQECLTRLEAELGKTGETIEARNDIYAAAKTLARMSRVLLNIISPLRSLRKPWRNPE
jgi:hypothetical protein